MRRVVESPSAEVRVRRAATWLASRDEPHVLVVSATIEAASEIARRAVTDGARRAAFGWDRMTLGVLAASLARTELARRGLVPAGGLTLEAIATRVVHAHAAKLQRFAPIAERPGLPRALARTLTELRLASVKQVADPDLSRLLAAFESELATTNLADRAQTFAIATEIALERPDPPEALVFVDVPLRTRAEHDLVAALASRAKTVFAAVPSGDSRTIALTTSAVGGPDSGRFGAETEVGLGAEIVREGSEGVADSLARLHRGLFSTETLPSAPIDDAHVTVLSAPGESRECVEIARIVGKEAAAGTPFDRMAVLLRAPQYGGHLAEAFRRAGIPAFYARGTQKPDPSGRAFLALLACAAEGLSARRFAEYLSLGEVPDEDESGAPPPALPRGDRVAIPDEEALAGLLGARAAEPEAPEPEEPLEAPIAEEDRAAIFGTLRAPRHWERLLVDAAVIGGKDRWDKRLAGLSAKLAMDVEAYEQKGEDVLAAGVRRDAVALETLRRFAIPLVAELDALEASAPWGTWLDALSRLATRALRRPERVLSVLAELEPMAKVGPVAITEVRRVLEPRLSQLLVLAPGRRYGSVYVATIDEARGMAFDVVFVPGMAEKIFPQKVGEDPLLLDDARRVIGIDLPTNVDRTEDERLALRLAVGAARRRVVLSYPRMDVEQARPRTPSFYGLEVLRVVEGELFDFEYLAKKAAETADARIGWPAPRVRDDAIDAAEFDLAALDEILKKPENEAVGQAHYLLNANEHLARALRFRGRRWLKAWKGSDGLVEAPEEALVAIRAHAVDKRSFSPTALQNFAACPYRFLLSAVHRLAPREEPAPIEDLDPLTRGSLVHEVQYTLLTALRGAGLLPVTGANLEAARSHLDVVLAEVAAEFHERLRPAIERVWKDAIEGIAADLREWLKRMTEEPDWTPAYFELSFGLKDRRDQDDRSTDDPAKLPIGLLLRGSIDLVEKHRDGRLRATDHKTGKIRAKKGETVIGGGEVLQPVLYALTIENMFPEALIDGGRLYYCTSAGGFEKVDIELNDAARAAAAVVAKTVGNAVQSGFLPAAPNKDARGYSACTYCDYLAVCGPYEEIRTRRKPRGPLKDLIELRKRQ